MAGRKRPPLVAEIGRLLVEYPAKDWKALTDGLRDGALLEDLATALEDAVALVEKSKKERPRTHTKPRTSALATVAREDRSKAEILGALELRLTDGDHGMTLAYIRGFASSLGMKEELSRRRKQAIEQIIRYLATRTTVEIQAALRAAAPAQRSAGREYDRWVDLILGDGATTRRRN